MIGLAKSCTGGGALGNYILNEKKGYELTRNLLCGNNPKEIIEEMQMIQDLNQRAINKTFSMVLSPDIVDSLSITDDDLEEMVEEFLNKLGIDTQNQQFIAFKHTEKTHKHVHLIVNRVQPNGKLISDHHIGKRAQWAAHEVAKSRGLVSAKEKMIANIKNIEAEKGNFKDLRGEIFAKHQAVMINIPESFEEYQLEMKSLGINVEPTINKQGLVQGHRLIDVLSGKNFKASEINRKLGLNELMITIKSNEKLIENINTPHSKRGMKF
jgi:hypothetical protein